MDELLKDGVDKSLEGSWCIAEPKEHDGGFEQSQVSPEGSLPFIALAQSNVVIPPSNIELGDEFGILDLIDELID